MEPLNITIEGVLVSPLKQIPNELGDVLHMMRNDSSLFMGCGEIYFSEIKPGCIKAWKRHRKMTQHIAVPVGKIRLVLYDDRSGSPSRGEMMELSLGRPATYSLVRIPHGIWYGFRNIGAHTALIANCTDIPHDPEESESSGADAGPIPYRW